MYEVSSEIYSETDFEPIKCPNGRQLSKFKFSYPLDACGKKSTTKDSDGDLDVARKKLGIIEIEHSDSTVLKLVGLQVWRGALLLADYLFSCCVDIKDKHILELGAGVGLTSIAAAIYSENVISTDVDIGGILNLIKENCQRNRKLIKNDINVMELNFKSKSFSPKLEEALENTDIVLAADVIYDDDLTDSFIDVLDKILDTTKYCKRPKTVYIALEKRYVFTTHDLDVMPPCYDYFLRKISNKKWKLENIPIDFPQFFQYERCKLLVLIKVTN